MKLCIKKEIKYVNKHEMIKRGKCVSLLFSMQINFTLNCFPTPIFSSLYVRLRSAERLGASIGAYVAFRFKITTLKMPMLQLPSFHLSSFLSSPLVHAQNRCYPAQADKVGATIPA